MIVNRCVACDTQSCVRIAHSRTFCHCHDYCTCTYRFSGGGCCGECILSHWPYYCWPLLSIFSSPLRTARCILLPLPVLTDLLLTAPLHVLYIPSNPCTPTLPGLQRSGHYCHSRSHCFSSLYGARSNSLCYCFTRASQGLSRIMARPFHFPK